MWVVSESEQSPLEPATVIFSSECQLRASSLTLILYTLYQFSPISLSLAPTACLGSVGVSSSCLVFLKSQRLSSKDALSPQFPQGSSRRQNPQLPAGATSDISAVTVELTSHVPGEALSSPKPLLQKSQTESLQDSHVACRQFCLVCKVS